VQPDQLYFKTAPGEVTFLAGDPQWEHGRTDMQGTNPKLLRIRRTGKRPRPEKKKGDNEPILIPVNDTPSGPINFYKSYFDLAAPERRISSTSAESTTCL
jgi:hypothetical protein